MKSRKAVGIAGLLVVGVLATAGPSLGQGVGNVGALPSLFTQGATSGGWSIGPYDVVRDPTGPAWLKELWGPNAAPVVAQPGQTFSLSETLTVGGKLPWLDWHEKIITPGWEWVAPSVFLANGNPPSGLSVSYTPSTATQGGEIDFYFDPLQPGTQVNIRKQLQYVGVPGTVFTGGILIAEYPTPEPASLALLGLGGLAFLRRRRGR
ncbi:MAG TPA: PEP-CTERM sorting domain-containing protein [Phycisphaerae bacterium]|nr:PEP-CTERM sorting domain-containing protein [Phycisphaerae bacterium]HRY67901.1 PEP-CTERM sorting domain-containing protein [Phycisphaerae bacterium]HSA26060.1 PEP-CTERM sorting domain-containing protein [Phycisphaerae bacterium]